MNSRDVHTQDFDTTMRMRYVQSTTQVSPRTRAQLYNRLHAVLAQDARGAHHYRPAWLLATACSLALVFGFGMQWHSGNETPAPTSARPVAAAVTQGKNDNGELVATLDESPDLYLWLASDDAQSFAAE